MLLLKRVKFGDVFQAWVEELSPDIAPLAVLDVC